MKVMDEIGALWRAATPAEKRSREAYQSFYRRMLVALKLRPIKAVADEAGNCRTCGESGRCSGWHFEGESF